MGKMKELQMDLEYAVEVFGDLNHYQLATDEEMLEVGDEVTITNANCEFEFDNVKGCFEDNLYYYFIADLELVDTDYSNYDVNKSNNGGAYAFATCRVKKIHQKTY